MLISMYPEEILYTLCRLASKNDFSLALAYCHITSSNIAFKHVFGVCFLVLCRFNNVEAFFFSRSQDENVHKFSYKLIHFVHTKLKAVDQCLRYLYRTKFLGIKCSAHESGELMIQAKEAKDSQLSINTHIFKETVNLSFANNLDRKSTEAFLFKLYDGLIDWSSNKQVNMSTFIIEADLLALLRADKQLI